MIKRLLSFFKKYIFYYIEICILTLSGKQQKSLEKYKDYALFNKEYVILLLEEDVIWPHVLLILRISENTFLSLIQLRWATFCITNCAIIVYWWLTDEISVGFKFFYFLFLFWIVWFYITTMLFISFSFCMLLIDLIYFAPFLTFICFFIIIQTFTVIIPLIFSLLFLLLNFISEKLTNNPHKPSQFLLWFHVISINFFKKHEHLCSLDEKVKKKYTNLALVLLRKND